MASPIISELSPLDKFFFYFFLPTLAVFIVGGQRLYFKSKKESTAIFKISNELIYGSILPTFIAFIVTLFLYFYILNSDFLKNVKWEILTLIGFVFLGLPVGIGVGAHLVAVSVRKLINVRSKEIPELIKAVHYFHYPFSHNMMFSSVLLLVYSLAIMDFFKGRSLELARLQIIILVVTGVMIGSGAGILFIITKSHRLILRTILILLLSLGIMSLGESRTLAQHPVAFLFTVFCSTVAIGTLLYMQTHVNLRPMVKRAVKKWLQWDIDYL